MCDLYVYAYTFGELFSKRFLGYYIAAVKFCGENYMCYCYKKKKTTKFDTCFN